MVDRIRTLLESRQLTPTQFADLIGVARPIISHILSGRNKPSLDVVQRILAALPDLSMAWLLNGTEPMLTAAQPATAPEFGTAPAVPAVAVATGAPNPVPSVRQTVVVAESAAAEKTITDTAAITQVADNKPVVKEAAGHARPRAFVAPTTKESVPTTPAPRVAGRLPEMRRFSIKRFGVDQSEGARIAAAPVPQVEALPAPDAHAACNTVASLASTGFEKALDKEPSATPDPQVPAVPRESASAPLASVEPVLTAAAPTSAPSQAPTLANDMAAALFTGTEKPIRRIVIFYRDGSFADYQPE